MSRESRKGNKSRNSSEGEGEGSKSQDSTPELRPERAEVYRSESVTVFVEEGSRELKTADSFYDFQEAFFDGEFGEEATVTIEMSNVFKLNDATIKGLTNLCRSGQPTGLVWHGKELEGCHSPLDVAMHVVIDDDDITGYCQLKLLFIAALASLPKRHVPPLVKRAHQRLKSLGFDGDDLRKFRKEEEEKRKKFDEERGDFRPKIVDIFPHLSIAKTASNIVVPRQFIVNGRGVLDEMDESNVIIPAPLFVDRMLESDCGTYQMVSIWFQTRAGWKNKIVLRDVICDKRKLLECAKFGLAVTNDNALQVVRYLNAFEQANKFTVTKVTHRLGRHVLDRRLPVVSPDSVILSKKAQASIKQKADKRVAGMVEGTKKEERRSRLVAQYKAKAIEKRRRKKAAKLDTEFRTEVANDGVPPELPDGFETVRTTTFVFPDRAYSSHNVDAQIEFAANDPALREQVAGFRCHGELDEYIRLVNMTSSYPVVRLMVVAALTSLLRLFIDFPNLILDICGRTTCGKTTSLRLAAAAFGCPNPSDPDGSVINSLSGTPTFIERRAGLYRNLPLLMDESKVGNRKQLTKFAYLLAGGTSKGRGTIDGVQKMTHFETIGIFTGEEPIVCGSKSGGVHVRIATLFGSPFGEESAEIGALADEINEVVSENYGHAARAFLDYLFENQCEWPQWKKTFTKYKKHFKNLADGEGNKYLARLAPTLAAFKLCEKLLQQALKIPSIDVVEQNWHNFGAETSVTDQSQIALEHVYNYFVANGQKFCRTSQKQEPTNGWIGKVDLAGVPSDGHDMDFSKAYLGFMPEALKEILKEAGFDAYAVIRQWKLDELLICDDDRNTHQVTLNSGRPRLIAIRKAAIDSLISGADSGSDSSEGGNSTEEEADSH